MADYGTVTITEVTFPWIKKIKFVWLSENGGDNAGKASKTTVEAYTGQIIGAIFVPDTGATAPTTLHDITVTNEDGRDILHGVAANLPVPIVGTGRIEPSSLLGVVVSTRLTLNVENAGDAKGGTVYLYIG